MIPSLALLSQFSFALFTNKSVFSHAYREPTPCVGTAQEPGSLEVHVLYEAASVLVPTLSPLAERTMERRRHPLCTVLSAKWKGMGGASPRRYKPVTDFFFFLFPFKRNGGTPPFHLASVKLERELVQFSKKNGIQRRSFLLFFLLCICIFKFTRI